MSSRTRWIVVWCLALLPLLGWWLYGLFDVDEGFYGAVTAEMVRRGEWITPLYNGKPWFEKPILLYWLAKPCLLVFGDMIGPRLPSVLTALGVYAVTGWFMKRRFGEKVSQLAVLILAGSLIMIVYGRMMMTDMPLVFCLTAAMVTFWESLSGNPRWRIATAGLLGLGVLAKGPVALILFAIIAGWTYWREPALRKEFKGGWVAGTALLLVVISTWYVPEYMANGQLFVQKFLVEQNLNRFTGGDTAHTLPGVSGLVTGFLMYAGVLIVGMLPWSAFIVPAWPRRKGEEGALERYLATWASVIFIFFAISGAKLPHYLLPMFPPLAMQVGLHLSRSERPERWLKVAAGCCVFMFLFANGGFMWWYRASGQAEVHAIARYVRKEGGAVAMYQMGRREKELGTGKTKLMETSLPSLLMVLNKDVLDTDNLSAILKAHAPMWVITRSNRIQPADFINAQRAGKQLVEVKPPVAEDSFKLYVVR